MLEICRERRNCKMVVSESGRQDGQRNRTFESKINAISVRMTAGFHSWTPHIVWWCSFVVGYFQSFLNSGALANNLRRGVPKISVQSRQTLWCWGQKKAQRKHYHKGRQRNGELREGHGVHKESLESPKRSVISRTFRTL